MPAGRLSFPVEPEEAFPMRHEDWLRIRKRLAGCRPPKQTFASFGWAVLGIAVGAALALLTWLPARSTLPADQWAWVTPTLAVVAVAGGVVTIVCFLAQRGINADASDSVASVIEDMDRVYGPHGADRLHAVQ